MFRQLNFKRGGSGAVLLLFYWADILINILGVAGMQAATLTNFNSPDFKPLNPIIIPFLGE